jgi:hypothetical protein
VEGTDRGDPNLRIGGFTVRLQAADATTGNSAFTQFDGLISKGPAVDATIWELRDQTPECELLVPTGTPPLCDPACVVGTTCVEGGVCQPDPEPANAGTATVSGLQTTAGTSPFTVEPRAPKYNYPLAASTSLAYPPCAEGDEVSVALAGGDVAAFDLKSTCIAPLAVVGDTILLNRDQPVHVQWNAPSANTSAQIEIELDISHHGGAKGLLRCEVPDTGSFQVPATLATQLLELGYSGWPTIIVRRRARGSAVTSLGRVDLDILQMSELELQIEGLVSCNDDTPCIPLGQTCQQDKLCG